MWLGNPSAPAYRLLLHFNIGYAPPGVGGTPPGGAGTTLVLLEQSVDLFIHGGEDIRRGVLAQENALHGRDHE